MQILYLTTVLPFEKTTGGEIASLLFIDELIRKGKKVHVIGYLRAGSKLPEEDDYTYVSERYIETTKAKFYSILWFLLALIKNIPYSAAKYYSKKYIKIAKDLIEKLKPDLIIIDHSQLGWLLNDLRLKKIPIVFNAHNVENEIYLSHMSNTNMIANKIVYQREARLMLNLEASLVKRSKQVWALTEYDTQYFRNKLNASDVYKMELISKFSIPEKQFAHTHDIGIIGTWTWQANMAGLKWFFERVYPLLDKNIKVHVAGRGADWLLNKYENVIYRGFVNDALEFMCSSKVLAIPAIDGGGIQIKTLDAIATGSRLVTTAFGLRGIDNYPSTLTIADTPEQFADALKIQVQKPVNEEEIKNVKKWTIMRKNNLERTIDMAFNVLNI